jgi:hypothetical protein
MIEISIESVITYFLLTSTVDQQIEKPQRFIER